jgi:hypothetical protein
MQRKGRCVRCGFLSEIGSGVAVHTRRKHPLSFHAVNSPAAGAKARWDPEERYLLAKEEVRLKSLNVWDMNKKLQHYLPERILGGNQVGQKQRSVACLLSR